MEENPADDAPHSPEEAPAEFDTAADETILEPATQAQRIGDFEVLGKLGQGGMGAVYRARQISLDRQVALKILPATLEADADFVARFQREARIAASLSHANLVKVYSTGQADGSHFIAMELVEGETLGQLVKRGPLAPPDALRICLDVAHALKCGWDRAQLIHRDIKPGNIFLSERGEVKVGDLGLAKSMAGDTTGLTNTGTAMGTPHYISPEQANGEKDLDFRADIYSLGCTLYQMLTGQTPYAGSEPLAVMSKHINAPPPAILKVLPNCPIPVARLVGKMLKKAKRERHGSYGELISQIESVQSLFAPTTSTLESTLPPDAGETMREAPSTSPATQGMASARSKLPLYAGVCALVLGLTVFFVRPKKENLTKVQLAMKQKEAGQLTTTRAPTSPRSTPGVGQRDSTTAMESGAIKLWDAPEKIPAPNVGAQTPEWKDDALHLDKEAYLSFLQPSQNAVVRAKIRMNPNAVGQQVHLTVGETKYRLALWSTGAVANAPDSQRRIVLADRMDQNLAQWPWPRSFDPNEWVTLELRAIDGWFTASFDGAVLGKIQLPTQGKFSGMSVGARTDGYFRDIEYVPLDAVTASEPVAVKLWDAPEKIPAPKDGAQTPEWKDDALHLDRVASLSFLRPSQNAVVRAKIRMNPNAVGQQVHLTVGETLYRLSLWSNGGVANAPDSQRRILLAEGMNRTLIQWPWPRSFDPDEWVTLELRAIDGWFTASFDGAVLGKIQVPIQGKFSGMSVGAISDGYFREIEYVPLDDVNAVSDVAGDPGWTPLLQGPPPVTTKGSIQVNGDTIIIEQAGWIVAQPSANAAIRAKIVYAKSTRYPALRLHSDGRDSYKLGIGGGEVLLSRFLLGSYSVLKRAPIPEVNDGESVQLEFRCVGQELTALVNGKQVISIRDDDLIARDGWGISGDGAATFTSVEGKSITSSAALVD